jgi:RNA polymerase sigma factor (sigma-70 family)
MDDYEQNEGQLPIENERFRILLRGYPAKAIKLLHDLYHKQLLQLSWTYTHDSNAAKDILQETFLHLWDSRKELAADHEVSIEHYLVRVVKFKSISYYKLRRTELINMEILLTEGLLPDGSELTTEDKIIEKELIQSVREFISTFPPREQEYFLMRIDNGLKVDQIAQHFNVSPKTVEASITRSNKRLQYWGRTK